MINYIVHDVNASVDSKIKRLKMKHKMAGYGLYWSILEQLALSEDGKLDADFNVLGYEMRESAELVKSVICDFDLFEIDNGKFFSRRLLKSIEHIHSKSEKAKIAGIKSGEARRKLSERLTDVQQSFNERSADVEQSKVKQSKVENINNISIKNDGGDSVQLLLPSPDKAKEESKAAKQEQIALEGDFNFFWTIYPKKKGKKEALKAYLKARKKASKNELLEALREIKAKEWKFKELQYVPNASTWLNQERWADEVQEQKKVDVLDTLDLESNPFDF